MRDRVGNSLQKGDWVTINSYYKEIFYIRNNGDYNNANWGDYKGNIGIECTVDGGSQTVPTFLTITPENTGSKDSQGNPIYTGMWCVGEKTHNVYLILTAYECIRLVDLPSIGGTTNLKYPVSGHTSGIIILKSRPREVTDTHLTQISNWVSLQRGLVTPEVSSPAPTVEEESTELECPNCAATLSYPECADPFKDRGVHSNAEHRLWCRLCKLKDIPYSAALRGGPGKDSRDRGVGVNRGIKAYNTENWDVYKYRDKKDKEAEKKFFFGENPKFTSVQEFLRVG